MEVVSGDAGAGEGFEVVGGVGRADIAGLLDEVVSDGADASVVLVYLVLSTDGGGFAVLDALTSHEVIADDADALAQNIIVYLVEWASDGHWFRPSGRGSVDFILRSSFGRAARPEFFTFVGVLIVGVGGNVIEGCSLRVECN